MSFFLSPCLCLSLSGWNDAHIRPNCCSYAERVRDSHETFSPLTSTWLTDTLPTKCLILSVFFFPSSSSLCPSLQVLFPLQHYQPNDRPTCHVTLHLPSVHVPGTYQCGLYAKNSEALVLFPYLWIFHFPMLVEFELMEYMVAKPRAVSFRHGICSHSTFWGGKECNKMKTLNPGQLLIFPHLYLLTMCNPTVSIIELIWLIKC